LQHSLFPDAVEILSQALTILRDLDLRRARTFLERARRLDAKAVNLRVIEAALALLEQVLGQAKPQPEHLAAAIHLAGRERLAGRLDQPTLEFIDETLARYWQRHGSARGFIDGDERLHRGLLDLIRGDAITAWRQLSASVAGRHGDRADLWGYRGDAAVELGRSGETSGCYVRALLLSPGTEAPDGVARFDLVRCRLRPLIDSYRDLCRSHPDDCARELLLVRAWLEGTLTIPANNGWIDERRFDARRRSDAAPWGRYRRFAQLLYTNRSLPPGIVGLAQREEMAALHRGWFDAYMTRCREVEG
jgi:hypothetical protein